MAIINLKLNFIISSAGSLMYNNISRLLAWMGTRR